MFVVAAATMVFYAPSLRAQTISTYAGKGVPGYGGDGGLAFNAYLNQPMGLATDDTGNIYIADYNNNRVRKIRATGNIITTIAGNGQPGYTGDGGPATQAKMKGPCSIAIDHDGNIYVAEYSNSVIRKISPSGIISTAAGTGADGYNGDWMPATIAQLNNPFGIALDDTGNLYIADYYNQRIRKVHAATGLITTIAGDGAAGYNGDNIPATSASLNLPAGVAVDSAGNVYIADEVNNRVRRVSSFNGVITTIAGNGTQGYNGDNIGATSAQLNYPFGVTINGAGNIYISEYLGERVRKVAKSNGFITTLAGTGVAGYNGDYIPANTAKLHFPLKMTTDPFNNLYVADMYNARIRKIQQPCDVFIPSVFITCDCSGNIYQGENVTFTAVGHNGGSFPVYNWRKNGVDIPNAVYRKYSATDISDNDTISCCLKSNSPCAAPDTGLSNKLVFHLIEGVPHVTMLTDLKLYPNPATNNFTITGHIHGKQVLVSITDMAGRCIYKDMLPVYNNYLDNLVTLPQNCPTGLYNLQVQNGNEVNSLRFSVVK